MMAEAESIQVKVRAEVNMPVLLSKEEMIAVFALWDTRYRNNPKAFQSDVERFLAGQTVEEYGDAATRTFLGYLDEVKASA